MEASAPLLPQDPHAGEYHAPLLPTTNQPTHHSRPHPHRHHPPQCPHLLPLPSSSSLSRLVMFFPLDSGGSGVFRVLCVSRCCPHHVVLRRLLTARREGC